MTLSALEAALSPHGLTFMGGFHPEPEDDLPGCATLLLIGPSARGFWPEVTEAPEFSDGSSDPLDRWSRRVLTEVARYFGARAYFPFAGPPWPPFIGWALRSGRAWGSPVGLLVDAKAGLWVSYRGALGLQDRLPLHRPAPCPCEICQDKPCLAACPVGALTVQGYDLDACHGFLDTDAGQNCMTRGCQVRNTCPVSRAWGRVPSQSAFHMKAFQR